ncbi:hypothetical protein SAMN04515674_10111 [Pseudarcicella hirudinis]|uniref:Uncharacterized protein n=1 Tax=Pseudarcicella hirudinis TaxID=1079859 RepID=A0A1I5LXM3_9BACT|nr:hypothetical protein SAMN04515674_10111 [Pseudarcicella hirudinis]
MSQFKKNRETAQREKDAGYFRKSSQKRVKSHIADK